MELPKNDLLPPSATKLPRLARPWLTEADLRKRFNGATILVVSKDVRNAGTVLVALSRFGCQVRIARSRRQAQLLVSEAAPNVSMIDADDAEVSASTLLRELSIQNPRTDQRFVALIANESPSRRRRLARLGFSAVITKPLDTIVFPQELAGRLFQP